jgi:hypothetical protein
MFDTSLKRIKWKKLRLHVSKLVMQKLTKRKMKTQIAQIAVEILLLRDCFVPRNDKTKLAMTDWSVKLEKG